MIRLGLSIRRLRLERGLSQKALAKAAGITPSFLSLLENDKREPSLTVIRSIAKALKVPEEILIWDAVGLPPNLKGDDRRICEIAKLLVHRYYQNVLLSFESKASTDSKTPSTRERPRRKQ